MRTRWSGAISLVGSPVLALTLSLSLRAVPGPSAESLALSLRMYGSLFAMERLLSHPILLLTESGYFPFLEGLRGLHVDAGISKCLGKSASENGEEERVV